MVLSVGVISMKYLTTKSAIELEFFYMPFLNLECGRTNLKSKNWRAENMLSYAGAVSSLGSSSVGVFTHSEKDHSSLEVWT